MEYFAVMQLNRRRIREEDGTMQYLVQWAGSPASRESWEPRSSLALYCAEAIQRVDQNEMEATDAAIERWREGRGMVFSSSGDSAHLDDSLSTNSTEGCRTSKMRQCLPGPKASSGNKPELLSGVLLRHSDHRTKHTSAQVLLLGEVILTEEAADMLNPTKRRRTTTVDRCEEAICTPALHCETTWRERFGVSLVHSCVSCSSCTPIEAFAVDGATEKRSKELAMAGAVEIIGLAPPDVTCSGDTFTTPVSFVPWIGEVEAERLRRQCVSEHPSSLPTVQELLREQHEQLVVRYAVTEPLIGDPDESDASTCSVLSRRTVTCMPLSVFRFAFPQLLLDYLLKHTMVLEG